MWRNDLIGGRGVTALAAVTVLALLPLGASAAKKKVTPVTPMKGTESVGDLATVFRAGETQIMGVGLVTGLAETGGDCDGSFYRTKLVDEMRKRGVPSPSALLAKSKNLALVIVRATIGTGVDPKDRLDVDLELPPGTQAKSLAGGTLMLTRLGEVMLGSDSRVHDGPDLALAEGAVMIGNAKNPDNPKVGRVLGGMRVKKEIPYSLVIHDKHRSLNTARLLEEVINRRFHQRDGVDDKGMARGKTDGLIVLKVPAIYHQNQEHYFRVVQSLAMIDTPELRAKRVEEWSKQLLDPKTSGTAALKLEGLGPSASEALTPGLSSPNAQVRFFAGEALAYLDNPEGVDVLGETAVKLPQFRAYALAALAAMTNDAAHIKLRKLMDEPDTLVRYGAFMSLRALDPGNPFLGRVRILDDPTPDEDEEDPADHMAYNLGSIRHRKPRPNDPFELYMVDSDGPPLVHVSRSRRSEIVIFGRRQQLLPPVVLGTGAILLNASVGDDKVQVSKIVSTRFSDTDEKVASSLELEDVLRRVANLGATYPEIVSILLAAEKQKNLSGALVVDASPTSNTDYIKAILGKDLTAKKDDAIQKAGLTKKKEPQRRRLFNFFRRPASAEDR
jgi:flagellar basal body P-ring protein FlgI